MIDRAGLAEFLRNRRESIQPEEVGLPRGTRRRTSGLRREEVAVLCHMSTDYYSRLERGRGPRPSGQMLSSMSQGLRLSLDERDHLFRLAGHQPPDRCQHSEHISPGMLRILDHLTDTPAEIVTELGETLRQTPMSVALTGDTTHYSGPARSVGFRWFTDLAERQRYAPEEHSFITRTYASGLRQILTFRGPDSRAAHLADLLLERSEEFRRVWNEHEIGVYPHEVKRLIHPEVGTLELMCQRLIDPGQAHSLLVYTAVPGTESHDKLHLLSVVGNQSHPVNPRSTAGANLTSFASPGGSGADELREDSHDSPALIGTGSPLYSPPSPRRGAPAHAEPLDNRAAARPAGLALGWG